MISIGIIFFLKKILDNKSILVKIIYELISIVLTLALLYYAGQSFSLKGNEDSSLFIFLIVGEISLILPMVFAERIISYFQEMRNVHFYQTLLGLQISPTQFILSKVLVDALFPFLRICSILLACFVFFNFYFLFTNLLFFFLLQVLSVALFTCMALSTNMFYLKFGRGIALFHTLQSFAAIAGGLYFPTTIFPKYFKNISDYIPQTQILKISRAIFQSQKIDLNSVAILLFWLVFFISITLILQKYLISSLKRKAQFF